MVTEAQRKQIERKRVLAQDQSLRDQHLDPVLSQIRELEHRPGAIERAKAELMEAERKRASTLMEHVEPPVGGRHQQEQKVVGKSPGDPWGPPRQDYWAWADMGQGPTFNKQLHSVDRERGK